METAGNGRGESESRPCLTHTMKTLYDAMKSDGGVPTLDVTVTLMQSEQEICLFTRNIYGFFIEKTPCVPIQ